MSSAYHESATAKVRLAFEKEREAYRESQKRETKVSATLSTPVKPTLNPVPVSSNIPNITNIDARSTVASGEQHELNSVSASKVFKFCFCS